MTLFSLFLASIMLILVSTECSVLNFQKRNLTCNNQPIDLVYYTFSKNFLIGMDGVSQSKIYKFVFSGGNAFDVESINIQNPLNKEIQHLRILQNKNKGISAYMIMDYKDIIIYDRNLSIYTTIRLNVHAFDATFGENLSQSFFLCLKWNIPYPGRPFDNITAIIQKYHNNVSINSTILFTLNDYIIIDKIVYLNNKLYLVFADLLYVFDTKTWQILFKLNFPGGFLCASFTQKQLIMRNVKNISVYYLSNMTQKCNVNLGRFYLDIKTIQSYTFLINGEKILQFDNEICAVIGQLNSPVEYNSYQIQYNHETRQFIFYFVRRVRNFIYSFTFDQKYYSKNRSCLPTYGYLAGMCIKNYKTTQQPQLPGRQEYAEIDPISQAPVSPFSKLLALIIIVAGIGISYLGYLLVLYCLKFAKIKISTNRNREWCSTFNDKVKEQLQLPRQEF